MDESPMSATVITRVAYDRSDSKHSRVEESVEVDGAFFFGLGKSAIDLHHTIISPECVNRRAKFERTRHRTNAMPTVIPQPWTLHKRRKQPHTHAHYLGWRVDEFIFC